MKRAKYMAQTDIFAHPSRLPYGENLYWKSGRVPSCKNALEMWYREKKSYNYASGSFSPATGHFTQMIWAGSQYLGCASAKSRNTGRIYIAVSERSGARDWLITLFLAVVLLFLLQCNYWPQGNVRTQFKENVPPPGKYYAYN